jgi:hypothetical protein
VSGKIECGGIGCKTVKPARFFYALKETKNSNGDDVVLVYLVDERGCPIEKGNIISLPKNSDDIMSVCAGINRDLDLQLQNDGSLDYVETNEEDNTF